ncbi:MAG TPA: SDR family NAD(P)-dependent oxidoreductase [Thermoanaerobaculia bacterium]|nr:SDR family NAD(P)-dependent oxidoreductase [Thermoanaerobaculia bacterium]
MNAEPANTPGRPPVAARPKALIIGNSDGIGLALTRRLLREGWLVTGVSRRASPIGDPSYEHDVHDVSDPSYGARLAALQERKGPFAVCVYCVGIGHPFDPGDLAAETQVFRVNLLGAVETSSVVLPPMLAAGRGHFVALSSIADASPSAAAPSYAASKAGLSFYLAGLALAVRSRGVYVTNVRFGFVDTKMAKSPVRPMMMTVDRAVELLMRCLRTRPAQMTYPRSMAVLVRLLGWVVASKLWFS